MDEQKKYQDQGQREEKEDRLDSFFKEIKIEGIYYTRGMGGEIHPIMPKY